MTLRPLRTRLALVLAALVAASPLAAGGATATAGATDVAIGPYGLPRGADVVYPRIVGGQVVVGETRIDVPGTAVYLLGRAADHYVVVAGVGSRLRFVSVAADRAPVTLPGDPESSSTFPTVSSDGERLILATDLGDRRSVVTVVDTDTGRRVGRQEFRSPVSALDARGERVLVGHLEAEATMEANLATGRVRRVADDLGYGASYRADRLATFDVTRDDLCSRVVVLSAAQSEIARTCRFIAVGFAPDGRILQLDVADDADSLRLRVADVDGRPQATYRTNARSVVVYGVDWLDDGRVLFEVASPKRTALIACLKTACERVSALAPADPQLFGRAGTERDRLRRMATEAR